MYKSRFWLSVLGLLFTLSGELTYADDAASQAIGRTPERIQTNFQGVIANNIGQWPQHVSKLSKDEIAALGSICQEDLSKPIGTYAPSQLAAYRSARSKFSQPETTSANTLEEIYLDFRTAPVGVRSPGAALYETTVFASTNLGVNDAMTDGIAQLVQKYAPSLLAHPAGVPSAADGIARLMHYVANATSQSNQVAADHWKVALADHMFRVKSSDFEDSGHIGDWSLLDSIPIPWSSGRSSTP